VQIEQHWRMRPTSRAFNIIGVPGCRRAAAE
jgi:hypothetical protein